MPADGIYAGWYVMPDGPAGATAVSLGRRPTFYEFADTSLLEAHLSTSTATSMASRRGCSSSAYLRPELKFESVEGLITQMGRDVHQARGLLADQGSHRL